MAGCLFAYHHCFRRILTTLFLKKHIFWCSHPVKIPSKASSAAIEKLRHWQKTQSKMPVKKVAKFCENLFFFQKKRRSKNFQKHIIFINNLLPLPDPPIPQPVSSCGLLDARRSYEQSMRFVRIDDFSKKGLTNLEEKVMICLANNYRFSSTIDEPVFP